MSKLRIRFLVVVVAALASLGVAPSAQAGPCRPNDGACQPKVCHVRGGDVSVDPESGTIAVVAPYLECYY